MKFYKVTYSNFNFRVTSVAVKAESKEIAINLAKEYEGDSRFAEESAKEITEKEYLSFDTESFQNENIRF